mgnify:CR=1 FL=1
MKPEALRRLTELAEARRLAALSRLDALLAEDRALAAKAADLAATPLRDRAEGTSRLADQDRRLFWMGHSIEKVNRRREVLEREIDRIRAEAQQHLGRHEALERLGKAISLQEDAARLRKLEREAMPADPRSAEPSAFASSGPSQGRRARRPAARSR